MDQMIASLMPLILIDIDALTSLHFQSHRFHFSSPNIIHLNKHLNMNADTSSTEMSEALPSEGDSNKAEHGSCDSHSETIEMASDRMRLTSTFPAVVIIADHL